MHRSNAKLTDKVFCGAVADSVKDANQTTRIANRLLIPDDWLLPALAFILCVTGIFLHSICLVGFADREYEEQGACWTRDECEHFGIVDTPDIVEGKSWRKAKFVN